MPWGLLAFFFGALVIVPLGFAPSVKNETEKSNNEDLTIIKNKLEELVNIHLQKIQNQDKPAEKNPSLNSRIIELLGEGKSELDAKEQAEAELFVANVKAEEEENKRNAEGKKALIENFSNFNKMIEDENIREKAKEIKRLYGKSAAIDFLKNEAKSYGVETLEIPEDFVL